MIDFMFAVPASADGHWQHHDLFNSYTNKNLSTTLNEPIVTLIYTALKFTLW